MHDTSTQLIRRRIVVGLAAACAIATTFAMPAAQGQPPVPYEVQAVRDVTLRDTEPKFRIVRYTLGASRDTIKQGETLRVLRSTNVGAFGNAQRWLYVERSASVTEPRRHGWVYWGQGERSENFVRK